MADENLLLSLVYFSAVGHGSASILRASQADPSALYLSQRASFSRTLRGLV